MVKAALSRHAEPMDAGQTRIEQRQVLRMAVSLALRHQDYALLAATLAIYRAFLWARMRRPKEGAKAV